MASQLELVGKILARSQQCLKKLAAAHTTAEALKAMIKKTHHQVREQEEVAARKPENCDAIPG